MTAALRQALSSSLAMSMRSFRKDGTPVDTPIWVTPFGDRFCSYTDDRSFKAKRLRRNPNVEIAASDVWGVCSTAYYPATCRIIDDPEQRQRMFAAIEKKYGIHWKLSLWGSMLTNRVKHRLMLEWEIAADAKPLGSPFSELIAV